LALGLMPGSARIPPSASSGAWVASGQQVVGADSEPAAQLEQHLQRRSDLFELDARDVLVRDPQLFVELGLIPAYGGAVIAIDGQTRSPRLALAANARRTGI
jgi:hypothetical protein